MQRAMLLSLVGFLAFSHLCASPALDKKISRYITNGIVLVADDKDTLYRFQVGKGGDQRWVPASIWKIATASAALHYLGESYRFKTEVYLNGQQDITLRGYGDPLWVSEEMARLVSELKQARKLPVSLRHIYLDDSVFGTQIQIPGIERSLNPYDALNGALMTNFNTIHVEVLKGGSVRSAEPQTPLTPLAQKLGKGLKPGKHRINISRQQDHSLLYTGQLFRAFLEQANHKVIGISQRRIKTQMDRPIHTHYNEKRLLDVIEAMMLYSNNFIANQLLLAIGIQQRGEPATLKKGVLVLEHFLSEVVQIPANQFQVSEGSGISRENRISPDAMITLLKRFYPHQARLTRLKNTYLKTGTLRGVYALAGYLPHTKRPVYFVIMLNQPRNYREQVLAALLNHPF